MRYLATLALCGSFLLGSCDHGLLSSSPEENAGVLADAQAHKIDQAAADDSRCQSFGAKPSSDAYVQCMVVLAQTEAQIEAQNVHDAKEADRRRREAIMKAFASNPRTDCVTNVVGSTAYTSCH